MLLETSCEKISTLQSHRTKTKRTLSTCWGHLPFCLTCKLSLVESSNPHIVAQNSWINLPSILARRQCPSQNPMMTIATMMLMLIWWRKKQQWDFMRATFPARESIFLSSFRDLGIKLGQNSSTKPFVWCTLTSDTTETKSYIYCQNS